MSIDFNEKPVSKIVNIIHCRVNDPAMNNEVLFYNGSLKICFSFLQSSNSISNLPVDGGG